MSELIRHLRHGGPHALAAAKALLESKPKLSPAEIAEVKQLLPELKDLFGAKLFDGLSTLLTGLEKAVPVPQETLMPQLDQLRDVKQLPKRFTNDLQLVRPQLVNHPALTREQKATRLFAFLVPFLTKLVKAPQAQREEVAPKLLERTEEAGFKQLEDKPTRRDGVQVARELLQAQTPEQLERETKQLQLDAPGWPETPPQPEAKAPPQRSAPLVELGGARTERQAASEAAREAGAAAARGDAAPAAGGAAPNARLREREEEARERAAAGRTNKRLGPQLLWNALHLFRDDGRDDRESAAQRDEMNRLAVGMALALGFLTVMVVLLFALR